MAGTERGQLRIGVFIAIGAGLGATVGLAIAGGPGVAVGIAVGAASGVLLDTIAPRRTSAPTDPSSPSER